MIKIDGLDHRSQALEVKAHVLENERPRCRCDKALRRDATSLLSEKRSSGGTLDTASREGAPGDRNRRRLLNVMRRSSIAVIAATLVLGGCGGGGGSSNTVSETTTSSTAAAAVKATTVVPAATQLLRCGDFIDTGPPPRDYSVVLNVVGLPTSPHSRALQTARTRDAPPQPRLFAKTGLLIRADSKFSLLVPPRERLWIGWANGPAQPHRAVVVRGCARPSHTRSGWLAYPGGFWVQAVGCYSLIVKSSGREQRMRLGLGAPCSGQSHPKARPRADPQRHAGSSRAAGHGHESTPANRSRRHLLRSRRRHLGPLRHLPRSARLARDVRTGSRADGQMRLHRPADRARQGNRHRMRMCSWCKERRSGRDGLSSGSGTTDRPHVGCREHVSQRPPFANQMLRRGEGQPDYVEAVSTDFSSDRVSTRRMAGTSFKRGVLERLPVSVDEYLGRRPPGPSRRSSLHELDAQLRGGGGRHAGWVYRELRVELVGVA